MNSENSAKSLIDQVWPARGYDLLVWYAKHCGISDLDIAECTWIGHWASKYKHKLVYDPFRCVWRWKEC